MDLWCVELDRAGASLALRLSELWHGRTPKSPPPQDAQENSLAIVADGSRWSEPIRLITQADPRLALRLLVIDARLPPGDISHTSLSSITASVASGDAANIERIAASVGQLVGDEFAFALINMITDRVTLVRDPVGTRPLYWRREKNRLAFASSRDRLLAVGAPPRIDEAAVAITLASGSDPWCKHELIGEFQRVPHGGYTLLSREAVRSGQWWRPPFSSRPAIDRTEAAREIRSLLEQAVASRLGTDHAIGAHVSGGIDSTGLAAIGAKHLAATGRALVGAYSWSPAVSDASPDLGSGDERRRVAAFNTQQGAPIRFSGSTAEEFVEFLSRPIELEGTANLADDLPVLRMAQLDGVQIMLSGWGGDEVFSSHGGAYLSYLLATLQWNRAASWIRAHLRTLRRLGPLATFLWWQGIHPMLPDALHRLFDPYETTDPGRTFISPDLLKRHRGEIRAVRHAFRVTSSPSETMFNHLMVGHIPHRIETWDVWSRQHGFNYTYPLTDRRLIERLLNMAPEQHFPNETPRGLAMDVLADVLPAGVSKYDAANEASRVATRYAAGRILANQELSGHFRHDCPWLDMARLRNRLANPVDETDSASILELYEVFKAVRVWHMWCRQEGIAPGG